MITKLSVLFRLIIADIVTFMAKSFSNKVTETLGAIPIIGGIFKVLVTPIKIIGMLFIPCLIVTVILLFIIIFKGLVKRKKAASVGAAQPLVTVQPVQQVPVTVQPVQQVPFAEKSDTDLTKIDFF